MGPTGNQRARSGIGIPPFPAICGGNNTPSWLKRRHRSSEILRRPLDFGPRFGYITILAFVKEVTRRQAGPSGETGARGRICSPFPGGFGHHVCRQHDRHARCSLQPGPAPAGKPRLAWRWPRETWSEAEPLGCVSPLGKSRGGTPEGVRAPAGRAPQRRLRRLVNCAVPAFRILLFCCSCRA